MQVSTPGKAGMNYTVQFEWARTGNRARPTQVTISTLESDEISSDLLRSLPLKVLKTKDVEITQRIMKVNQDGIDLLNSILDSPMFPDGQNPARTVSKSLRKKPRKLGSRIPETEYEKVARLYVEKSEVGYSNISVAISREMHCSPETIRKRIAECRKRGLIPPASKKGRR